jgi:hypothetical protein
MGRGAHAYTNDKREEYARYRRRDHANLEDIQNLVIRAIGDETGHVMPPRVRHFVSVLQGTHGGGEVINEPFQRSHATVAERLNLKGSAEAKEQAVRRLINQLEEYQKRCKYRLFFVERGGQFLGRDSSGREQYSTTTYTDFLKPVADEGVQRARAAEQWRGNPEKGIKPHPGRALAEQVEWVKGQLPRVDEPPKPKTANVLSLADYVARREDAFLKAVEDYADGVEEREGDPAHYLELLEVRISRLRQSRQRTAAKDERGSAEAKQRRADARVWADTPMSVGADVTTNTAYTSAPEGELGPLPDLLENLTHPPTKVTPPPDVEASENNNLAGAEVVGVDDADVSMLDWALWWAGQGFPVFPLHDVFDGICSCKCSPKKCKEGKHGCADSCANMGKHPRTRNGLHDATTDEKQIREWWRRWPNANLGGRTGGALRLVVLDFDPRHGGDASLADLQEAHGGEWQNTLAHQTGSLGFHFFYQYPEGVELSNSAGLIGPGVDTRAEGGYVVLPPSGHATGRRYEMTNAVEIAPAPDWLLEAFREDAEKPRAVVDFQEMRGRQTFGAGRGSGERFNDGERNSGLFGVGIGRWRHGWARTEGDLLAQLEEVNAWRCSPPLDASEVGQLAEHIARDYSHLCGVDGGAS